MKRGKNSIERAFNALAGWRTTYIYNSDSRIAHIVYSDAPVLTNRYGLQLVKLKQESTTLCGYRRTWAYSGTIRKNDWYDLCKTCKRVNEQDRGSTGSPGNRATEDGEGVVGETVVPTP